MAHSTVLLQDGSLSLPAQFWERGGDTSTTVEWDQPSSRASICSFVPRGTERALPEPCRVTSSWLLACMFLTKLLESVQLDCFHSPASCSSIGIHQNWQDRHWWPSSFTICTSGDDAAILQHHPVWPVWQWASEGLGGISLQGGHQDLMFNLFSFSFKHWTLLMCKYGNTRLLICHGLFSHTCAVQRVHNKLQV